MIGFFAFIFFCLLLSGVIYYKTAAFANCAIGIRRKSIANICYYILLISLIMFAGLRTRFNDTKTYMLLFLSIDPNITSFRVLGYGGFELYESIIKLTFGNNPQIFIFVSAFISIILILPVITRHTRLFLDSMLLYMLSTFVTTMAAIKQILAMGFALRAIEAYMQGKKSKSVLMFLISFSIHPFVVCLLCFPLLMKAVFDRKTIIIIIITVLVISNLDRFLGIASMIGKDYTLEEFTDYTINPFRVLVEALPAIIIISNRRRISTSNDAEIILGSNLSIISFLFIFLGFFYNPMYMGRLATYFSLLSAIEIPKILRIAFKHKAAIIGYYSIFLLYFIADFTKLGTISLFSDVFSHTSFLSLFR